MDIPIYQVDAFAEGTFTGNPAAVCPLDQWLPDELMQSIAMENALSETAFFVQGDGPMEIRWFTPTAEVELCGHATLATAHILRTELDFPGDIIEFTSLSGPLSVIIPDKETYMLNFPADTLHEEDMDSDWSRHFGQPVIEIARGKTDFLLRLETEAQVRDLRADLHRLGEVDCRGFIVTAPGENCDYVARCFYPATGVPEDPATGSSQTTLAVYWAPRLGKTEFKARQLSARGGSFETRLMENRVLIAGKAVSYMSGKIHV